MNGLGPKFKFNQFLTLPPNMRSWDFFICHASEDKDQVVRPLAKSLIDLGFSVWFDEMSLKLGDSLRKSIENGLAHSRYGIVVLSPKFFSKQWPQRELDSLINLEISGGKKKILPIWHKVKGTDIQELAPLLSDKIGIETSNGIEAIKREILCTFSTDYPDDHRDIDKINKVLKPILDMLVSDPGNYSLNYIVGDKTMVIEFRPFSEGDLARIIGRTGQTARALRTILAATMSGIGKRGVLEILE